MTDKKTEALKLAQTLEEESQDNPDDYRWKAAQFIREALAEQPAQHQEPVSLKSVAQKAGISLPETYIPTMDDAIVAGDSVLMNEQAALLRECRAALDSLIAQKPTLAGLLCGSTTLGNLKAELGAYRPQGVFGDTSPPAQQEPVAWMHWLHGPVRLFLNKDEAQMELDRLNREYPVDADGRKMRPLVFGDTSPPASKPLTDEQIGMAFRKAFPVGSVVFTNGAVNFARAIEAAHTKGDA